MGDGECAWRAVRGNNCPREFALAEGDAANEELKIAEGLVVERHLSLGCGEKRPSCFTGFLDGYSLGHQAAEPEPAEALELEVEAARLQLGEDWTLHEAGDTDLVEPDESHQHREHEQPRHDADAAEPDAADAPEGPRLAFGLRLVHRGRASALRWLDTHPSSSQFSGSGTCHGRPKYAAT